MSKTTDEVIITVPRDGRGPATSAHLRSYYATINGKPFGWFADYDAAVAACMAR